MNSRTERKHYDLAAVAAASDSAISEMRHRLDETSSLGAQARINHAALTAIHVAVIAEINRGTDGQHIIDAVATLFANVATTTVQGIPSQPRLPQHPNDRFNRLVAGFLNAVAGILTQTGLAGGRSVPIAPMKSGRA